MRMETHSGIVSTAKNPDSSTIDIWESYQQSNLVAKQEEICEFDLRNIFFLFRSDFLRAVKF
jgi:hypothetical protein